MKRKKAKRKFKRPLTGLRTRGKGKNPHSAVFFHKDFVHDKLRHTVLTVSQMAETTKRKVQSILKPITTGTLVKNIPDGLNGWSVTVLDMFGRVLLVAFNGIEVCVFFKRQLTEVVLQPGDHVPEGVCQDPEEAWQRLDLIGLSAKKANLVIASQHDRLETENEFLKGRVQTLETLNDELESKYRRISQRKEKEAKRAKKRRSR